MARNSRDCTANVTRSSAVASLKRLVTFSNVIAASWRMLGLTWAGAATKLARDQLVHAEQVVLVRPHTPRHPVGRPRQRLELCDGILIRVLRMNCFAGDEAKS